MTIKTIVLVICLSILHFLLLFSRTEHIQYRGFGWYGYNADYEFDMESVDKIKDLGGNSVNLNVYYEYSLETGTFDLKSNLTRVEENIELAHQNDLTVFLSPFVNLVGGHYMANSIVDNTSAYLSGAQDISIELAEFSEENDVELYSIWTEMGLSLIRIPNSTELVNEWIQNTRMKVDNVYDGDITTKEGVQLRVYKDYNFSGFDYIGVSFYPFTDSYYTDPYTNMTFAGVHDLDEYERIVKNEYDNLEELEKKFGSKGIILGEIGIDVVDEKYVGRDNESRQIRAKAYDILLEYGKNSIDGFYFGKFEHKYGGSEKLDDVFKSYFKDN